MRLNIYYTLLNFTSISDILMVFSFYRGSSLFFIFLFWPLNFSVRGINIDLFSSAASLITLIDAVNWIIKFLGRIRFAPKAVINLLNSLQRLMNLLHILKRDVTSIFVLKEGD